MSKKKIILTLIGGGIGAFLGYGIGISIHDLIAYTIPLAEFSKHSWFDVKNYLELYNKYSYGLREFMGKIFGFVGGSLSAYLGYEIGDLLEYKNKY